MSADWRQWAMTDETVTPRPKKAKRRYYFREWRKHRGLTLQRLADRSGLSAGGLSQLETGKQGFTDTTLEVLADALNCEPGDLLTRNPLDKAAPWSVWETLTPMQREQATEMLKILSRTGTDG